MTETVSHSSNHLLRFKSSSLVVVMIVVLVPLLLFLLSVDSPCYELWGRIDSSWYFTSGKAWMNGMVPYVDFTDSKGPLLWLIYGIGSLLSNYNYVGVWVLTCVALVVLCVMALGTFSFYKASQLDNFKLVHHRPNRVFDAERVEYYRHIDMVKKVKQPRIVFYNCNNVINVADETGGLPGCKYFAKQFGATGNMIESQYEEICRNRPHFIYVKNVETECLKQVKDLGYFTVLEPGDFYKVYLLASPELQGLYR